MSRLRAVAGVLATYAASRVVLLLAVGVAMVMTPGLTLRRAVGPWDVAWYLLIAESGYPSKIPIVDGHVGQNESAFFPIFPLTVRAVAAVTPLGLFGASVAVAVAGGAAAAVALWFLVRSLEPGAQAAESADRSVALFAFFPSSFVFLIGYSEGLMLPFAIGCLHALLKRKWWLAGALAAAATAIRPNALALCLACAWAAVAAIVQRREWRALIAPLLSPIGFLAYLGFLWARMGDPLVFFDTQRHGWDQRIDLGATTVDKLLHVLDQPIDVNAVVSAVTIAFLAGAVVLMVRWKPPAVLTIYSAGVMVPPLLSAAVSSRPRFALTAFPFLVAYARGARGIKGVALVGVSAVLLAALTILTVATQAATP